MGYRSAMRVLLIEDDRALLDTLALAFRAAGHEAVTAADGALGLALGRGEDVDVIVSDVNLPGVDGFTLCRTLRAEGRRVPIVLLTSRDSEIDEALGLDLGADDYVTKPFSMRVLLARLAALLRRARPEAGDEAAVIRVGALAIDPARLEVRYQGVALEVTVTELRLLEALARRPGVIFSRQRLLTLAREDDSVVAPRIVDTYVARLRKKIAAIDPAADPIETVIGAGYRIRG
jgi:DNA-binding response OmpR family regulator